MFWGAPAGRNTKNNTYQSGNRRPNMTLISADDIFITCKQFNIVVLVSAVLVYVRSRISYNMCT